MRFTTYERVQSAGRLVVVKKDGARVPFDRDHVLQGIIVPCIAAVAVSQAPGRAEGVPYTATLNYFSDRITTQGLK